MLKYDIFGSKDSQDYDVMVYIDQIPKIARCKELSEEHADYLASTLTEKKVDVNLAVLKDGIIIDVYKGTPDECNNSVFFTAEKPYVTKIVPRNVTLKIARALRTILSFLSRTEHRPKVKKALKSNAQLKIEILSRIDFQNITNLNKNNQSLQEFYKQSSFQLIQVMGLIEGCEIYSKQYASEFEPSLINCLYRRAEHEDVILLNDYKKLALEIILNSFDLEDIKE